MPLPSRSLTEASIRRLLGLLQHTSPSAATQALSRRGLGFQSLHFLP